MDVHTKEQRRYNMQKIAGKNTKPEEIVRKFLYHKGLRYKKNDINLPGKPDLYISKYNVAIFVNGCFWHVHNCDLFVMPKSNQEFWQKKLEANVARDEININKLNEMGIRVIVVWECGLKKNDREETLNDLYHMIIDNL
ncbi:very short patch repair endonuclease [Macrococcus capreoli]